MIRDKNIILLMDSHLEGKFSTEEATVIVGLASQCLQYEPRERPCVKDLITTLSPFQPKSDVRPHNLAHLVLSCIRCYLKVMYFLFFFGKQVPSHVMLGISKHEDAPPTPARPLSSMGQACSRMDLTAMHQILLTVHYKDDEGTSNEVILSS